MGDWLAKTGSKEQQCLGCKRKIFQSNLEGFGDFIDSVASCHDFCCVMCSPRCDNILAAFVFRDDLWRSIAM